MSYGKRRARAGLFRRGHFLRQIVDRLLQLPVDELAVAGVALWLFGLGALFIAVVLAFPNGLSGIWADYVQPRIDRLLASRKSKPGSKWADNSVADGAPAE